MIGVNYIRVVEGDICYICGYVRNFITSGKLIIKPDEEYPESSYCYRIMFCDQIGQVYPLAIKSYDAIDLEAGTVIHLWLKRNSATMVEIVGFDVSDPYEYNETWPEGISPDSFLISEEEF